MKNNYCHHSLKLLLVLFILGSTTAITQNVKQIENSQVPYSVLPDPASANQSVKPPTSIPFSSEGSVVYADNIVGSDFYYFDIDDPANWASIASVNYLSYSGDFRSDDTGNMWIIDGNDNYLKKISVSDGAVVDSLPMPCPLASGIWTCISYHKVTGQLFAVATSTVTPDSRLYSIDQTTGTATELLALGPIAIISGTFDMDGRFFGFDIFYDTIYSIDVANQSMEALGYAGFDGNFAQGMACDPETNKVYLATYQLSGVAELRLLNKNTGATSVLETLPGETTAFAFPPTSTPEVYSVNGVYTNSMVQPGDTIWVYGYYTDTIVNILVNSFSDWITDQILPPQTALKLHGVVPPATAQNGGLIFLKGKVSFENVSVPSNPEDTLMAHINVMQIYLMFEGYQDDSPGKKSNKIKKKNQGSVSETECDSCKFAVLISGGWDTLNNHSKYWENLVALYNFKVDSEGYCKDNVFVHYFKGDRRDDRIPTDRVFRADSAHIDESFTEISKRVAACTNSNQKATFQKMVTNHGEPNGDIDLLKNEPFLKPAHLRDMQQMIIDSCCSLVYDEFLECYGGYCVDSMLKLDPLNKAKIYANSNADHQTGISPLNRVHPYLKAKIDALGGGKDYEDAVVDAKLAYDDYLRGLINHAHHAAQWWRNHPFEPDAAAEIAAWVNDSIYYAARICKSRNVSITPMKEYCQWAKFVVPPGGQLVLKFKGKNSNCGNSTVYWVDPATGHIKYKVFNWNVEGSAGYSGNNKQRVINGIDDDTTTFWVHNDDGMFKLTSSANGNQDLAEDASNTYSYPGFSFGGNDDSSDEFSFLSTPVIYFTNIDQVPFTLNSLPAYMGTGYTTSLGGTFNVDPADIYASQMVLHLDVAQVIQPGTFFVNSSGTAGTGSVDILEPGEYNIPLGDLRPSAPGGFIELIAEGPVFSVDCWGVHSVYQPLMVNAKVFLQGPFQDGLMQTGLNPDYLPLSQPFNTPPWNYNGPETVDAIPNNDVADWVLIELRQASDPTQATSETVIGRRAGFLLNDGSVVAIDGDRNDGIPFAIEPVPPTSNLWLVIRQRNHLGIMSGSPLVVGFGGANYDFTTGAGQAFGSNAMVDLGDGIFGMIGGDSNGDGIVNNQDKDNDWNQETGESGYLGSDLNLDGQSNNSDKNEVSLNNINAQTQVPE